MRILVVDDEKLLVKGMKFNLENEGYEVECAYDGAAAVELTRTGRFDLVILDVMMPEISGLEACMRIREFSNVPIIMLTAKSEDADKLMGFESGADDYLTKPFNILELKARVRALLRRAAGVQRTAGKVISAGPISLNTEERTAARDGPERGAHRQGIRSHRAFDAQSPPGLQPGEPDECGLGLLLRRRLPDGGRAHPPAAGKAGAQPGGAGVYSDQVGSGLLFQGLNGNSGAACGSSSA
jgi:CheY-like chemotaxis protein